MASKWRMSGFLLGECNCDWGCPCSFDAPPSHGSCRGVYTWIIDKGAYGDATLNGLGVALPGLWPGAVHLGHGTQLVLIDGRATPAQRRALETLGKGEAGGPVAVFASVTERWLPPNVARFQGRLQGGWSPIPVDSGKGDGQDDGYAGDPAEWCDYKSGSIGQRSHAVLSRNRLRLLIRDVFSEQATPGG